jgi:hypothetical protein
MKKLKLHASLIFLQFGLSMPHAPRMTKSMEYKFLLKLSTYLFIIPN